MAKYAVFFQGFAYVEADDPEAAEEAYQEDDIAYSEVEITSVQEVDEFSVHIPARCADG